MRAWLIVVFSCLCLLACDEGKDPVSEDNDPPIYEPQMFTVQGDEYTSCVDSSISLPEFSIMLKNVSMGDYYEFLIVLKKENVLTIEESGFNPGEYVVDGPYGGDDVFEAGIYPYFVTTNTPVHYDGSGFSISAESYDDVCVFVSYIGAEAFAEYYGYRIASLEEIYLANTLIPDFFEYGLEDWTSTIVPEHPNMRMTSSGACRKKGSADVRILMNVMSFRCAK